MATSYSHGEEAVQVGVFDLGFRQAHEGLDFLWRHAHLSEQLPAPPTKAFLSIHKHPSTNFLESRISGPRVPFDSQRQVSVSVSCWLGAAATEQLLTWHWADLLDNVYVTNLGQPLPILRCHAKVPADRSPCFENEVPVPFDVCAGTRAIGAHHLEGRIHQLQPAAGFQVVVRLLDHGAMVVETAEDCSHVDIIKEMWEGPLLIFCIFPDPRDIGRSVRLDQTNVRPDHICLRMLVCELYRPDASPSCDIKHPLGRPDRSSVQLIVEKQLEQLVLEIQTVLFGLRAEHKQ